MVADAEVVTLGVTQPITSRFVSGLESIDADRAGVSTTEAPRLLVDLHNSDPICTSDPHPE
jgi:hypothetical protein